MGARRARVGPVVDHHGRRDGERGDRTPRVHGLRCRDRQGQHRRCADHQSCHSVHGSSSMRIGAPVVDLVGVVATSRAPPSAADACSAGSAWPCRSVGATFVTSAKTGSLDARTANDAPRVRPRRARTPPSRQRHASPPVRPVSSLSSRRSVWSSSRFLQCRDCAPVRATVTGCGCRRNRAIPARWGRDIRPRCPSAARAVRRPTRYAGFSGWTRDAAATARSPSVTPADGHVVAIGTPPGDRRRSAGCADRVVRDGNRDLGPSKFVPARRTCGWAASLSAAVTGR